MIAAPYHHPPAPPSAGAGGPGSLKGRALNLRRIPPGLRARFKAACAGRGLIMEKVIVEFMELFVDRYEQNSMEELLDRHAKQPGNL